MTLTVHEMSVLCALHAGTLSATLDVLRFAAAEDKPDHSNKDVILSLTEKLSGLKDGDLVSLAFE